MIIRIGKYRIGINEYGEIDWSAVLEKSFWICVITGCVFTGFGALTEIAWIAAIGVVFISVMVLGIIGFIGTRLFKWGKKQFERIVTIELSYDVFEEDEK